MSIKAKLAALRKADKRREVFGAGSHDYKVDPLLSEAQLAGAEKQFGVTFPEDYRSFLLEVGAGGAGPAYGVFPLVRTKRKWGWFGDGGAMTGDLRATFPHTAAWNLDGDPVWAKKPSEDDEDEPGWDDAYARWRNDFEALYWQPRWTAGAICLHHEGCALRNWLVVTGPERGHMWFDATADEEGLSPVKVGRRKRATFTQWYEHWLDKSLASVRR